MAEKIDISELKQISFNNKSVKAYTAAMADPESKLGLGSAAAEAAAQAAALALKAVKKTASEDADLKKAEDGFAKLREYFVHLIDEENKAKLPLEKRLVTGAPENEIEAGYLTACMIVNEVLYSTTDLIGLLDSVADKLCPCTAHLCAGAMYFAKTAMECARLLLAFYSTKMKDEVGAHTTRREPEIAMEGISEKYNALLAKFEGLIK